MKLFTKTDSYKITVASPSKCTVTDIRGNEYPGSLVWIARGIARKAYVKLPNNRIYFLPFEWTIENGRINGPHLIGLTLHTN